MAVLLTGIVTIALLSLHFISVVSENSLYFQSERSNSPKCRHGGSVHLAGTMRVRGQMPDDEVDRMALIKLYAALEAYVDSVANEPIPDEIARLSTELNLLIESKKSQ